MREIYKDPDYLDDPLLGEQVQQIWTRLMAAARARGDATVPTSISLEKATNPFMSAKNAQELAERRAAKDSFQ